MYGEGFDFATAAAIAIATHTDDSYARAPSPYSNAVYAHCALLRTWMGTTSGAAALADLRQRTADVLEYVQRAHANSRTGNVRRHPRTLLNDFLREHAPGARAMVLSALGRTRHLRDDAPGASRISHFQLLAKCLCNMVPGDRCVCDSDCCAFRLFRPPQ